MYFFLERFCEGNICVYRWSGYTLIDFESVTIAGRTRQFATHDILGNEHFSQIAHNHVIILIWMVDKHVPESFQRGPSECPFVHNWCLRARNPFLSRICSNSEKIWHNRHRVCGKQKKITVVVAGLRSHKSLRLLVTVIYTKLVALILHRFWPNFLCTIWAPMNFPYAVVPLLSRNPCHSPSSAGMMLADFMAKRQNSSPCQWILSQSIP